uniref:Uncharacterized protein n=1 Tax=Heterorhabditis bacteriophora TaxID=37862 RepID=A0A1I7WYM1_HETBA
MDITMGLLLVEMNHVQCSLKWKP